MPDPETKENHIQKPNILELIFPKIEGLEYGSIVDIELKKNQIDSFQFSYQNEKQIPGEKYGLKYDVIGKTDFEFDDVIIDTKATAYIKRLKSGAIDSRWYPKDADLRQQALYKDLFNKPTALLYCSIKDVYSVDMEGREGHLETIIQAMSIIEHILDIAETKEDIVKMYPLVMDNFRWGKSDNEPSRIYAKKVWQEAFK